MPEIESTTDEVWKPVPIHYFSTDYSVSNMGRVRQETKRAGTWPGRILQPTFLNGGYAYISLSHNAVKLRMGIHILVAWAFYGLPPGPIGTHREEYQVDHINSNPSDNRLENLQWVTATENNALSSQRGRKLKGQDHGNAIFADDDIRHIRHLASEGVTHRQIADRFNTQRSVISTIVACVTWRHIDPQDVITHQRRSQKEVAGLHPELRPRGVKHHMAKLAEEDIQEIRSLARDGVLHTDIATQFAITIANVGYIVAYKTWKHVNPELMFSYERRSPKDIAFDHPYVYARGEWHPSAKLTEEDVRAIRHLSHQGLAQHVIAEQFNITQSNVSDIVTYNVWKHVDPEDAASYVPKTRKEIRAQHAATQPRGEHHGKAKLTAESVRMIRQLATQGYTYKAIGERFGIDKATAASVINRKTWKHIE